MKLAWDADTRRPETGYHRERSDQLYHSARWTRLSRRFLANHLFCAECQRQGRLTPAQCVDHIIPMPICKAYFFNEDNLQALCNECNAIKGNKDKAIIQEWKRTHNDQHIK